MKIITHKLETQNMYCKLKTISEYQLPSGTKIICIETDKGSFTNFSAYFDRLNLDVDTLEEGDDLLITYKIHVAKNKVQYKNYVAVEVIKD